MAVRVQGLGVWTKIGFWCEDQVQIQVIGVRTQFLVSWWCLGSVLASLLLSPTP